MNRQKLIEDNMKLVYFVINKYYPTFRNNEDIIQTGMIGLCQAAKAWDENKGQFSTFAVKAILNSIRKEFRKESNKPSIVSMNNLKQLDDGEVDFADLFVDYSSEDFIDEINFKSFYETLDEREKVTVDSLKEGLVYEDVAKLIGCSRGNISNIVRRIKLKWRSFNENSD